MRRLVKLVKIEGYNSHKYGLIFTPEQERINLLIDEVIKLKKKVAELESRSVGSHL